MAVIPAEEEPPDWYTEPQYGPDQCQLCGAADHFAQNCLSADQYKRRRPDVPDPAALEPVRDIDPATVPAPAHGRTGSTDECRRRVR